jgi:phosphoserine phosphatase RsbU/P
MEPALDKAPCLYFALADDGTILEANEKMCTELGYAKEELLGKKTDVFFTLSTRIFYQTHFFPLLKMQHSASEIYIALKSRNGTEKPLLLDAKRTTENGSGILRFAGIVVHNRKKFEDELVAARKSAEAALKENTALQQLKAELQQRMEQLELHMRQTEQQHAELMQFNRVVTHDLQEPIRKISIFSNMLQTGPALEDPKPLVEKLLRSLTHMRSIVAGLQQYVWLTETPTRIAPLHANELLQEAARQVQQEFGDTPLHLVTETIPDLNGDREQLQMLFYHILSNAARFHKEGQPATVRVAATVITKNRFVAMQDQYRYDKYLRMTFADKGIGFDPVYREEVFRLFGRIHAVSGRGVGLALCRKILENHSGTISIDTEPGTGTTVTVLLPMPSAA